MSDKSVSVFGAVFDRFNQLLSRARKIRISKLKLAFRDLPKLKKILFWITLAFIVLFAGYLRFAHLSTSMHFDSDEANHVKTAYQIWSDGKFVLQGPSVSTDTNLYHGAFYYYLLSIPAIIFKGNPLYVGGFCALLSTLAVYFLTRAIQIRFGKLAGLISGSLLAVSFAGVFYGRWIWNPNLIPFFMSLSLYALAEFNAKRTNFFILFAFSLGALTQLHLGGLIFLPIFLLIIPLVKRDIRDIKTWVLSILAFLLPWIPTLSYEFSHQFISFSSIWALLCRPSHYLFWEHLTKGWRFLAESFDFSFALPSITKWVFLATGLTGLIFSLRKWRTNDVYLPTFLLLTLIFTFFSISFYPDVLFIHLGEQLWVIYAVMMMFVIRALCRHPETFVAAVLVLVFCIQQNLNLFQTKVVNGPQQYRDIKQICLIAKNSKIQNPQIEIKGKINPIYVTYVCQNRENVTFGNSTGLFMSPDFTKDLAIPVEKMLKY